VVIYLECFHVDKVYGKIGNGVTEPLDACLDSGDRVIVKPFNNIQGNLVLVNEYICYRLCTKLDIPIPKAGIALISERTECLCEPPVYSAENYGYCYFSKRIDKVTIINRGIIPRITNKADFYKIILFDHLIYNKDRNRGNLLVTSVKNPKLYAIDHTHVFKNQSIWDKNCLQRGMDSDDFNDLDIIKSNEKIYNYFWEYLNKDPAILLRLADEYKNKLNYTDLEMFINELPEQWHIPDEDALALKEYLIYRLNHMEDMCKLIIGR